MYLSPKQPQTLETLLTSIRSDPTNDTLQELIDDVDKAEQSVQKSIQQTGISKDKRDAMSSVFMDARQILELVRKR